jgi:hypothetical protein
MEGTDQVNPVTLLDYPLDTITLLQSAANARLSAEPYTDSRYPGLKKEDWYIGRYTDEHIDKIMRDFEVDGSPRFYWLEPFADIPQHVDNGTQCSINLIISENPAPITVEGVDYAYQQALLNTALPHSVRNGEDERIMLKISIFDETYESLSARIKYKLEI